MGRVFSTVQSVRLSVTRTRTLRPRELRYFLALSGHESYAVWALGPRQPLSTTAKTAKTSSRSHAATAVLQHAGWPAPPSSSPLAAAHATHRTHCTHHYFVLPSKCVDHSPHPPFPTPFRRLPCPSSVPRVLSFAQLIPEFSRTHKAIRPPSTLPALLQLTALAAALSPTRNTRPAAVSHYGADRPSFSALGVVRQC